MDNTAMHWEAEEEIEKQTNTRERRTHKTTTTQFTLFSFFFPSVFEIPEGSRFPLWGFGAPCAATGHAGP